MRQIGSTESVADSPNDTVRIPVLAELQQRFLSDTAAGLGVDPYQSDGHQAALGERVPRRTLDDMRRLSEAIMRARINAPSRRR
jgi:hypothetical protein